MRMIFLTMVLMYPGDAAQVHYARPFWSPQACDAARVQVVEWVAGEIDRTGVRVLGLPACREEQPEAWRVYGYVGPRAGVAPALAAAGRRMHGH